MFETIVAIATNEIKSALGIIRVSGDDCFSIVSKIFSKDITAIKERTCLVGQIIDKDELIDEVVINVYKGPKSFTGEDLVEIICHGSPLIEREIVSLLIKNGARYAVNGEYSSRAFLHNKMDLIQAESINDLINATSKESKNISLMSLKGSVSKVVIPIKTKLADLLSLIEVNIDFPEYEDIEVANKELIIKSCNQIICDINNLLEDSVKAKIIKEGINIALLGKPNVGKSSLLNAILGENKAIVTDIAGTTRDVVEGTVMYKGLQLHFFDTAGIRNSQDKIEMLGVNKSIEAFNQSDIVIVVLDSSSKTSKEDEEILALTENANRIIVSNKSDIAINNSYINVSAKDNNITSLMEEIYRNIGINEENFKKPALNNARQIGLLEKAKNNLEIAKNDADKDVTVDIISVSLMEAYKSILEILGESNQIDISKEIFSRFCVGK